MSLASKEEHAKRLNPLGEPEHRAVQIAGSGLARAYSELAIANVKGDDRAPWPEPDSEPICTLERGHVFVADSDILGSLFYRWAPVKCDEQPAFVRWVDTRLSSTVVSKEGKAQLLQVCGADCDAPVVYAWNYGPEGRSGKAELR